jgi:hypothetical protein
MLSVVRANMTTYNQRISAISLQKSVAPPKANTASIKPLMLITKGSTRESGGMID